MIIQKIIKRLKKETQIKLTLNEDIPPKIVQIIWSKDIKKRDQHCMVCGSTKKLQAHHINNKYQYPNQSFDLHNGVTLCATCHKEYHNYAKDKANSYTWTKYLLKTHKK